MIETPLLLLLLKCLLSVAMSPDTSVPSMPKSLDTSVPVPLCLTDSPTPVLKCFGPKCLGSEVSVHRCQLLQLAYLSMLIYLYHFFVLVHVDERARLSLLGAIGNALYESWGRSLHRPTYAYY